MLNRFVSIFFLVVISAVCSHCRLCVVNKQHKVKCVDDDSIDKNGDYIAWAWFKNSMNQTGWSYLEVYTNETSNDNDQAYFAGYLEGLMTSDLIKLHWHNKLGNYCGNKTDRCDKIKKFINATLSFTNSMIAKHGHQSPYWHQVDLILRQIRGMQAAYETFDNKTKLPVIFWLALRPELDSIETYFKNAQLNIENLDETLLGYGSCSAIVKPLADGSDLLVSHNTWGSYTSMFRVVKKYDFPFHMTKNSSVVVPGQTISFSSSPGAIHSIDDFYITSSGLVIQETTNEVFNKSLYRLIKPKQSVLEFIRNVVANRLAKSGYEWSSIFAEHNSGTYNNQFMVVDYKKFKPGTKAKDLPNGVLWVSEQLPGLVYKADVTEVLRRQGYWSSYNIAYFDVVSKISGYPKMVKQYGDYFDYNKTSRARIFRRDHNKVKDLKSIYQLMRYNDFKKDPLSKCDCTPPYSSYLTISARSDLNPLNGSYPLKVLGFDVDGAIDVKITSYNMSKKLEMIAESGPTHVNHPPFRWSKSPGGDRYRHLGHPDKWDFKPVHVQWFPEFAREVDFI